MSRSDYNSPVSSISHEDIVLLNKVKRITAKNNDAEIRKKKDGSLAVYEIKKRAV